MFLFNFVYQYFRLQVFPPYNKLRWLPTYIVFYKYRIIYLENVDNENYLNIIWNKMYLK